MRTRRWMTGSTAIALVAASACSSTPNEGRRSTGEGDAGAARGDASGAPVRDGGLEACASVRGCSGSATLPLDGDYVAADGSEHWLRSNPHGTTYTRVPAGPPSPSSPPVLQRVVKVCGDQRSFIVMGGAGMFARVDWMDGADGLRICIAVAEVGDMDAAIGAPASDASSAVTGCNGRPWITLARIADGGT